MLLTRSPLYDRPKAGYSFDLHVLGTPPAFILSQDQTLHSKMEKPDVGFSLELLPQEKEEVLLIRVSALFKMSV